VTETAAPPPAAIRYRAFLSYSHADAAWAKWLHAALEGFRIEKDLAGRETALGPVPQALRPVFRDREDFSGGYALTDATIAALDASSALIVLCSSTAANRPAVNEEVRLFRSRHPDRPVIPVIVEGTFPDNFPPALRHEIAPDGTVTDRLITILGPDLRESGDGKMLGLAKVVAGLIGISPDDIFRRAERARRQQARLRYSVVAVMVALTAAGSFFAWRSHETQQTLADKQATLAEIEAVVAKYTTATASQGPGAGAGLTAAVTAIANGSATDARYAKALELLKAGKPAEAEPLLKAVVDEMAARARTSSRQAAEAYSNLGAIARLADPKRAREYYARALELEPDDLGALQGAGWLEKEAGNLETAERIYNRLITLMPDEPDSQDAYWIRLALGDIRFSRGDLAGAMWAYQAAQGMAERAIRVRPGVRWQRDRSASYLKIGDVLMAQGNIPAALPYYRDGLAVAELLAEADPGNAEWQEDLSIFYIKFGDALMAQGKVADALRFFRDSLAIMQQLAQVDPTNTGWRSTLSISYIKVGSALMQQDNLAEALTSFRAGLAIAERLAHEDPGNAQWQLDVAGLQTKVGDALVAQDNRAEALVSYRASLAIAERLAQRDPSNAASQWEVVVCQWRLAEQGDEPARRWALIVAEMRKLKDSNRLQPDWAPFLPAAEAELAKHAPQEAQAAPQ